jgi:hypothetical protein
MKTNLEQLLDLLDIQGIELITMYADQFVEENYLSPDDKDFVTFHKTNSVGFIAEKLLICDYITTKKPIYKDWYMTINYHG